MIYAYWCGHKLDAIMEQDLFLFKACGLFQLEWVICFHVWSSLRIRHVSPSMLKFELLTLNMLTTFVQLGINFPIYFYQKNSKFVVRICWSRPNDLDLSFKVGITFTFIFLLCALMKPQPPIIKRRWLVGNSTFHSYDGMGVMVQDWEVWETPSP